MDAWERGGDTEPKMSNGDRGGAKPRRSETQGLRDLAREASERLESVFPANEAAVAGERSPAKGPRGRALVSHVSFGTARTLGRMLAHLGYSVEVATRPDELSQGEDAGSWDVVFLQGSRMPRPGADLISATLDRCVSGDTPVVLLGDPGEGVFREMAGLDVRGYLKWPFEVETVRRALRDLPSAHPEGPSSGAPR